jgi:hypothetical protein
VAAPTLGQWNADLHFEGCVRCLYACMGDVFLAIALVLHVLDWAQGSSACLTGRSHSWLGSILRLLASTSTNASTVHSTIRCSMPCALTCGGWSYVSHRPTQASTVALHMLVSSLNSRITAETKSSPGSMPPAGAQRTVSNHMRVAQAGCAQS